MTIHVLHTESSLGWGGQELRILTECEYLNRCGDFECSVVCDNDALMLERNRYPSVPIKSCDLKKKRIVCLQSLKAHIQQLRPHIVVSHSSTDSWLAAIARKIWFPEIKLVRVRHVSAPVSRGLFTKWLYHQADHLVTTSDAIREHMICALGLDPATVTSIPTGIETQAEWRGITIEEREAARSKLGFGSDDSFVFGMISTLRSWKGHEDALRALSTLPSGLMVIVGDGPQEENIRKTIDSLGLEGRVILVGHTPAVREVAAAFDAYLHPSYSNEGVSQSLLQAMSMGIPVIVSDIGGLNEVVRPGVDGLLVPPKNPAALADAMANLISSDGGCEKMAETARMRVEREYSMVVRGGQMAKLLKELNDY